MEFDKLNFMKLVMKIIACTPNKNFDQVSYHEHVLMPAKKLREYRDNIDQIIFDKSLITAIFASLKAILLAKQLDANEFFQRISEFSSIQGLNNYIDLEHEGKQTSLQSA